MTAPHLYFLFPMPLKWKRSPPAINTYGALPTEEGHLAVHLIWKIVAFIYIPQCKCELPNVQSGSTGNLSPEESSPTCNCPCWLQTSPHFFYQQREGEARLIPAIMPLGDICASWIQLQWSYRVNEFDPEFFFLQSTTETLDIWIFLKEVIFWEQ